MHPLWSRLIWGVVGAVTQQLLFYLFGMLLYRALLCAALALLLSFLASGPRAGPNWWQWWYLPNWRGWWNDPASQVLSLRTFVLFAIVSVGFYIHTETEGIVFFLRPLY